MRNSTKKTIKFSVIIPAFQEELVIGGTLDDLAAYLKQRKHLHLTEVIVVTATSSDKTAAIVREKSVQFPVFQFIEPGEKVGKGRDVREGMLAAKGEYVLFTDADLATPLHHVAKAFQVLEGGVDVVIGERKLPEIHRGIRKFVSLMGNRVAKVLIAPGVRDTQCGFKGFRMDVARQIFKRQTIQGWAFDMEVIAIARQRRYTLASIDIDDWSEKKPDDKQLAGENNLNAALKTFVEALKISANVIRGMYK